MQIEALQELCLRLVAALCNNDAVSVSLPLKCGCRYLRVNGVVTWLCTCPKCGEFAASRIEQHNAELDGQLDIFDLGARGGTGASEASSLDAF